MKLAALTSAIALSLIPVPSLAQATTEEIRIPFNLQEHASVLEGRSQAEVNYVSNFIRLYPIRVTSQNVDNVIGSGNSACRRAAPGTDLSYIEEQRQAGENLTRIQLLESARLAGLKHLCPNS